MPSLLDVGGSPPWKSIPRERRPPGLGADRPMYLEKFTVASKLVGEKDLKESLWRSLFRSEEDEDAVVDSADFVAAVRDGERCVRQALGSWSDRELRGLWAEIDGRGVGHVTVDDLIFYLFGQELRERGVDYEKPARGTSGRRRSSVSDRLTAGTLSSDVKRISRSKSPPEIRRASPTPRGSMGTEPAKARRHSDASPNVLVDMFLPSTAAPQGIGGTRAGVAFAQERERELQLGAKLNETLYALSNLEAEEKFRKRELSEAKGQIAHLDAQLSSVLEENKRLLQALAAEEGEKEHVAEKLNSLSEGYAECEKERGRLEKECVQLRAEQEEEIEAHREDVARLEKDAYRLEKEMSHVALVLKQERQSWAKERDGLTEQLDRERNERDKERRQREEQLDKERKERDEQVDKERKEREEQLDKERKEREEQVGKERKEREEQVSWERRERDREREREREREKRERENDRVVWQREMDKLKEAWQRDQDVLHREWERERDNMLRVAEEERQMEEAREQRERQGEREIWRKEVSERDSKARTEILRVQKQVEELTEANQDLQAALQIECEVRVSAQSTLEEQREALENVALQCEQLGKDLVMAQDREKGKEETIQAMRKEREGLMKSLGSFETDVEVLKVKLCAAESGMGSLKECEERAEARLLESDKQLKERDRECAELGDRLRHCMGKLEIASDTIAQMKDELQKEVELRRIAEDAEANARERLKEAQNVGDARLQDCKVLDGYRRDIADQLVALRRALEPRVMVAEKELKEEKFRREAAERAFADTERRLQAVSQELSTSQTDLEGSREAGRELKAQLEKLMRTVSEQRTANLRVVKENKGLLIELRSMEDRHQENLNVLLAAEEAKAKLQSKLEEQGGAYMKARERAHESEQGRIDEANLCQELREQIAVLRASCDSEQRASDRIREELKVCTEKFGAAGSRADELARLLKAEQAKSEEAEIEVANLGQKMYILQQKYSIELERSIQYSRTIPAMPSPFREFTRQNVPARRKGDELSPPPPAIPYRNLHSGTYTQGQGVPEGPPTTPASFTPVQMRDLRGGAVDADGRKGE